MSRDALLVGINTYSYERLSNLTAPAIDAEAIAKLLEDYGEFKVKRLPAVKDKQNNTIRVGQKTGVTLTQLEEAIVQLFKPEGKNIPDTALLYFSGHGLRKNQGIQEGFLATSDTNPDVGNWGLRLKWLRELLQESEVRQQIIWLDCCYSGELLNFGEADPGDKGKGRDRCFIAASREFEVAYEASATNYSVLTTALLQGLKPREHQQRVTNYTVISAIEENLPKFPQRPIFANSGGIIHLTRTQEVIPEVREVSENTVTSQIQQLDRIEQAVQIYLGIKQQGAKIVSSVNLISEPPTIKKKEWQGRQQEITQLNKWLQEEVTTIGIQGLSGVGKSWLAAKIYGDEQIKSSFEKIFWADVSQSPDFMVFAQNCLIYLGDKTPEQLEALGEPSQLINELLRSLKQHRSLLVLDNLETLLDENRHIYQRDYKNFFSNWANRGATSTLLLTTQIQPEIIEEQVNWLFLQGLETKDGEQLLRSLGIVGSDAELQDFSKCVNGHPKMLWLVAKLLKQGTHICEAEKLGLKQLDTLLNEELFPHRDLGKVQFVLILEQHWEGLTAELKRFFSNLSIYRRSFSRDAAAVALATTEKTATALQTQLALQELTSRSLLDSIEGEQQYQFHPFVFEYAKQKAGKKQDVLREKVIAYYQSMVKDKSTWKTLEDVAPYLEIFYQRCEQKYYAQAFDTLSTCDEFLKVGGYHATRSELYQHLVQAWEASDAEKGKLADAFFRLGVACYYLGQYLKTIEHCQQALLMAREVGEHQVEANALCWLGRAYHRLRQFQQAIEFNQRSLKIARELGDAKLEAQVLINLGNNFTWLKQYEKAIKFCQQGLDVAKGSGDLSKQTSAMNSLGNVYTAQEQYARAIEYYQQSIQINQQTGHRVGKAYCLGQLGNVYRALKQYQQAVEYYQQSLEVAREIGYGHGESVALSGLGYAYCELGQYQQALECYQQLLEIKQQIEDSQGEAETLQKLQEIEHKLSDITSGKGYD
jgi:tetratricopeptide (TPR) repeat protein